MVLLAIYTRKMWYLYKLLSLPFLLLIKIYQWIISPIFPATCRYHPTCSAYSLEAIKEWGILKGGFLAIKRIASCHPWGGFGEDPVPKKSGKENENEE